MNVAFLFHDSVSTTATREASAQCTKLTKNCEKNIKLFIINYNWVFKGNCQLFKNVDNGIIDNCIQIVKFGFSEKATKFEKIFIVLLTRASCSVRATAYLSKSRRRFFKTNVVKLYNTNFKQTSQKFETGLNIIIDIVQKV